METRYRQILTGQPSIETDIQHILLERSRVTADPDQQPLPGGLADDGVKRTDAADISMVECR